MALLLTPEEAKRVSETVQAVEQNTAGEVVVVVSPLSDEYGFQRAVFALLFSIAAAWGVFVAFPLHPSWTFGVQVVAWLLGWVISRWPPLLRLLVPKALRAQAVHARTEQAFIEHGVTETIDRSGVLIYISVAEHQVEILADRGIHERVGEGAWREQIETIVHAVREGHAADGLCAAVQSIGARLADCFPPRADDVNELPNHVIQYT